MFLTFTFWTVWNKNVHQIKINTVIIIKSIPLWACVVYTLHIFPVVIIQSICLACFALSHINDRSSWLPKESTRYIIIKFNFESQPSNQTNFFPIKYCTAWSKNKLGYKFSHTIQCPKFCFFSFLMVAIKISKYQNIKIHK